VYQIDYTRIVQWGVLGCDQLDSFLSSQTTEESGGSRESRKASTHTGGQLGIQDDILHFLCTVLDLIGDIRVDQLRKFRLSTL